MKKSSLLNTYQPLYVLATSLIGFGIVLCLYVWFYPHPDLIGQQFEATPQFWIWVFLLGVEAMFYTVVLIPSWKQFIDLLKEQFRGKDPRQRISIVIMLLLASLFFVLLLESVDVAVNLMRRSIQFNFPEGHSWRITFMTLYAAITVLPIILGMLLIQTRVHNKSAEIEAAKQDQARLFEIARELLRYRHILQTSLLIAGVMVSILPVATGALRSILVVLGQANDNNFPMTLIAVYGLFYTSILIVFYAPVHLLLAETSRKLRDELCPIDDLAALEVNLKKREALDEWLETNNGLSQNLRTGVVTLFPLITSLVVSLLGPNVKMP
jgi:hypothetical protein